MMRVCFLLLFLLPCYHRSFSQAVAYTPGDNVTLTVPNLALLGTNSPTISLNFPSITAAGQKFTSASNSALYLKVTSLVPTNTARKITVRLASGSIPAGTALTIQSAACTTANSDGALGTVAPSPITLSSVDQNLITDIRTCYTGSGSSDGYRITFTWGLSNPSTTYGNLVSKSYDATITFTVTAPE